MIVKQVNLLKCLRRCGYCFSFFYSSNVLTGNGLEFTNKLIKSKKGELCNKPSKLDIICRDKNIDHRLTKPATPQFNGMVERVNGTIKRGIILKKAYNDVQKMTLALNKFLAHYVLYQRYGGLRKALNVKTLFDAIEK